MTKLGVGFKSKDNHIDSESIIAAQLLQNYMEIVLDNRAVIDTKYIKLKIRVWVE